jgi:hypothetical protein
MGLYHKICVMEPLGHELRTKININALKTVFSMLVYSCFLSFVASIHRIKI